MLTLIALSAALIQDPPAPPRPPEVRTHFAFVGHDGPGRLDADGDGQITREEFSAPMADAFSRMDKDGDGRLSGEEMAMGHEPGEHDVMIMRGPGGPGGEPHRFEFRRPAGDGEGEAREVVVVRGPGGAEGEPRRLQFRRPGPGGEGPRIERDGDRTMVFIGGDGPGEREIIVHGGPGGEHPRIRLMPQGEMGPGEHRFEVHALGGEGRGDLDKDGDGKISEAEFIAPLREAFARMDADSSGFVEEGERGRDGDVRVFTHRIETREAE